ncbi:MAG: hypothetical protein H0U76_11115 [Ktedonobacteraceae bacterium]|nr:hypothetical protein [Ktedonobacteraceae bacterium]
MKKKKKKEKEKAIPPDESNPFFDGLLEWMASPDGELSIDTMDTVFALLENVDLDAQDRKLIWADGSRLSIDKSVQRIHADYPELPAGLIEEKVISWIEMGYAPEHYSEQQLDELDRLTELWIDDHARGRR